ncbi:hypothetical protein JCM21714_2175 [Gracilibacillus boraciitolerans JCM 21714]|uniref:Uncharacterized protein n=1 Tax=Gracilibacillus boraciitolerans JCM 21714 TaxID=1298598 RepID=W4VIU6_9BACI|nr:hypothetical protein [Gracilibacillus boraciitolerans]GAE93132.1 hypothetical protein JCM21714_2175 [Gracilibacillus boraciitolerans JCM 21714]
MLAQAERITGHATYTSIDRVLQIVDEINSTDKTSKQIEMLERVTETFTFLKDALDRVDPLLVSTITLQTMNNPISQILNEVTNFKNNRNEQYLTNALNHIETLLQYSSQLLVIQTPEDIEGVRSAVIKFRQSVGQHLSHLEKDVNDTNTAYSTTKQKLDELTNLSKTKKNVSTQLFQTSKTNF